MYYRCKEFKLKDASGANVDVKTINDNSEVMIYVNELRNSITVYPNITDTEGIAVSVNRTPVYVVAGGSLEITEGRAYKDSWVFFTENKYPEEGS